MILKKFHKIVKLGNANYKLNQVIDPNDDWNSCLACNLEDFCYSKFANKYDCTICSKFTIGYDYFFR